MIRKSKAPAVLTWGVLLFFYLPILLLVVNGVSGKLSEGANSLF